MVRTTLNMKWWSFVSSNFLARCNINQIHWWCNRKLLEIGKSVVTTWVELAFMMELLVDCNTILTIYCFEELKSEPTITSHLRQSLLICLVLVGFLISHCGLTAWRAKILDGLFLILCQIYAARSNGRCLGGHAHLWYFIIYFWRCIMCGRFGNNGDWELVLC